ncbi:B12-binding domain-containing radical SAM protein [archaeon]|jgi:anaerobic magnesium-protoporphyrin IX monomethyl ester cyclase|nr:B12-binding domain-containing radical SAM protein [archaeon]
MKIAGIYPNQIETDSKIQHAVSEPYGLEKILAIAKEQGHEVDLFTNLPEQELTEKIFNFNPDIAAFSLYTCQYPAGERIATKLKEKLPKIINIAGNRYPSFLKEKIKEPFDFFVIKEGEETFQELLKEITNGQNYESVKGLAFRKNKKGIFTGVRKRNFHLDSLPDALRFPVILNQTYQGISLPPLSKNPHYAIIESSRCCYNGCKFCDNAGFWGNRVSFRSPKKVVKEMFELKEKGTDIFYFMDLNFTAFPERTRELCQEMIEQKLDASWYAMSNTATVDGEGDILKLMKQAGCYKIAWGVESTNDRALEKMNKKVEGKLTTNNQTIRVLQESLESGILNQGYYIIGFPWETEESLLEDTKNLKNLPLHQFNIGIFTPIPLSKFYKEMLKNGHKLEPDLSHHDRNTLIYNHPTLTNKKIKQLQKQMHSDFYESPEYLKRMKRSCEIDPRFKQAFNEYFEFLGKEVRV